MYIVLGDETMKLYNKKYNVGTVVIVTIFLVLVAVSIITILQLSEKNFRILIDPDVLMEVAKKNAMRDIIIDLREQDDYELSHIESSINIPFIDGSEIDVYLTSKNSKNKTIYLLCYSGSRSAKAFNHLSEKRYKNLVYVKFGYDEFVKSIGFDFVPATGPCNCIDE